MIQQWNKQVIGYQDIIFLDYQQNIKRLRLIEKYRVSEHFID